jgi:glycosyltransferase involved in cell wall biosynthesis
MRMAIYISDLTPENQHLMPWRMVLEIGAAICQAGHQAKVLSGRHEAKGSRWAYEACPVEEIAKPYSKGAVDSLHRILRQEERDVLFWPVAWRCDRGQDGLLRNPSLPVVWYVPGACYSLRQAVRAVPDLGVRAALPFVIQSVYPKRHLVKRLRRPGASLMITGSQFSRSAVHRAGWPAEDVFFIPPGKAVTRTPPNGDEPAVFRAVQSKLRGRPFYLFLGPPTNIRGIRQLFQAFNLLASRQPEVCLVCLFRSDPWTDVAGVRQNIENGRHAKRILCAWQSVCRVDLDAFLDACHAVVLPFLLVPSEIPLAVIEAAGHHKPVITTGPGGTAEFVSDFGLAVPSGDSQALAEAMRRLLDDKSLYADKCSHAERIYAAHPTWEETARSWLSVAETAIHRTGQGHMEPVS